MPDLTETLAGQAAQEIVKALIGGLIGLTKKIPDLWRRFSVRRQEIIAAELERSATTLRDAGEQLPVIRAREEAAWETRLRDLLAEYPDAAGDLDRIFQRLASGNASSAPTFQQNVSASASGASAQGVIGGNIINYPGETPSYGGPEESSGDDQ